MSVSNVALATLDDVKSYYQFPKAGSRTIDNDLIEDLIDEATKIFHNYCGVIQFKAQDYKEDYDGDAGTSVFLHNYPVNSITSIHDDSDWAFGTDTLIASSSYTIVDKYYVVLKDTLFSKGIQNIRVNYNAGYSTIPEDLKLVCIEEVVRRFKNRKNFDEIFKTVEGDQSTRVEVGLLTSTKQVLDGYIRAEIC